MKHIFLSILLIISYNLTFSQLHLSLNTNKLPLYTQDADTLSVCRDSVIIFEAFVIEDSDTLTGNYFYWDFDDNIIEEGNDKDSLSHIYETGGGYRVKLQVRTADDRNLSTILPIKIAMPPNFSQTTTDIPETFDGVCINSEVLLKGKAYPEKWEDEPVYDYTETQAKLIDDTHIYESVLTFDEFPAGTTFADGNIDTVSLNIEHSNIGNLEIALICPNGTALKLKDYDTGSNLYFGEPVADDALPDNVGSGYDYYWSTNAEQTIPSSATASNLASGAYIPDNPFSTLNDCPMNGDWTIRISDNTAGDNGYLFSWGIIFNEDILPPVWTFQDSISRPAGDTSPYYLLNTYWIRPGSSEIGGTAVGFYGDTITATATANPDSYGNIGYEFHLINNWKCPQDTTYTIRVEKPSFTATPATGAAELTVSLSATTSWGDTYNWEFGDKTPDATGDALEHIYEEKGNYTLVFTAADKNGCSDTDTLIIPVSLEPSSIENSQNVFSPNDDGINDAFKVTVKGMAEFRITIYNRWGEKVYGTTDEDEITETGWNGRMPISKLLASPGVYFYVIKAKGKDGKEYKETGTVHLFR